MSKKQLFRLVVTMFTLTACGSGAATPTRSPATLSPTPGPSHAPSGTPTPIPATPTPLAFVEPLRSDLAQRLGIAPESIQVAEIQKTVWPDASLGCPDPEQMYAQVTTPGYLVRLELQDEVYEYHMAAGGPFLLCQGGQPQLPVIPVTPGEIQDGEPWMPAGPVSTATP
jgi:hypothetical protein